jgi:hypothetical protein
LLNSEYSCQSTCRQKQRWIAVRLKPRPRGERAFVSRRALQSRTGVGTNWKSAFPGARIQGGRRATGLSRLSFNIPSFSQRNAGTKPVRNPHSEYSGTRNIGIFSTLRPFVGEVTNRKRARIRLQLVSAQIRVLNYPFLFLAFDVCERALR